MLVRVVNLAEPNMLRGSFRRGHGDFKLPHHGQTTRPAYRADLTNRSIQRNRINPYRSLHRESTSNDGPMAVRTRHQGGSEGFFVMEKIPVASEIDNVTGRERGQTSPWCLTRESWANRLMRQSR